MDSPSVDRAFLLEPGIGFVRAASFDPQTAKLIKAAIEKLGGTGLKGLVLDLRGNPGGVVPSALETASLFLKPGEKILSVKGRSVQGEDVDVPKTAEPYSFPMAVLVNERTASAAEIVTGALQDHDRAVVVGEPTYGKGLVQSVFTLSRNTALALTTAFYYTPNGRSIQRPLKNVLLQSDFEGNRGGIQPDDVVRPEPHVEAADRPRGDRIFLQFRGRVRTEAQDRRIVPTRRRRTGRLQGLSVAAPDPTAG